MTVAIKRLLLMQERSLHAPVALLPDGWARDVRVVIDPDGSIGTASADQEPRSEDLRLTDRALLPAPSNLHSHAFQRAMAGRTQVSAAGPDSFWTWRSLMYKFLGYLTPDHIGAIAAQAQVEMCESGFAAVAEFHYLHHAPGGLPYASLAETATRIMESAEETGIGLTMLPVLYASSGANGAPPANGQLRFASTADSYERLYSETESTLNQGPSDWRIGIAPHSLRATPQDILAETLENHPTGPIHMHIAEQVDEVEEIRATWGMRPVEWLLEHHSVDDRWCAVHATHMTPKERQELANSGAVAGLCPVTEADLGDGTFPCIEYVESGGRYGVGTDSNVRITFAGELAQLEYSQRIEHRCRNALAEPGSSTGRTLFESALAGGVQALNRPSGAIQAGSLADLLTLDTSRAAFQSLQGDEVLDAWIFSERESAVSDVWSAGRHVVRDGLHERRKPVAARYRRAILELAANL
ncbi:MAG: formimidoylglutamate deiminase [Pseudomonadales bacterium]|nr:formimidoylglutamate deiminase [Pseudomonadales bacterium]